MRKYKGRDIGERIEAAIARDGRSRAAISRAAGFSDPSHLTRIVKGDRPINDEQMSKLSRVLGVPSSVLSGDSVLQPERNTDSAVRAMTGSDGTIAPQPTETAREHFIEGHRDELSPRDIEVVRSVDFVVRADSRIGPASDEFWWHIVESARRLAAEDRRGNGRDGSAS